MNKKKLIEIRDRALALQTRTDWQSVGEVNEYLDAIATLAQELLDGQ